MTDLFAENERLRACIKAEIDQHFKVHDKADGLPWGRPYCAADSFLWPCPLRRRLEAVLSGSPTQEETR